MLSYLDNSMIVLMVKIHRCYGLFAYCRFLGQNLPLLRIKGLQDGPEALLSLHMTNLHVWVIRRCGISNTWPIFGSLCLKENLFWAMMCILIWPLQFLFIRVLCYVACMPLSNWSDLSSTSVSLCLKDRRFQVVWEGNAVQICFKESWTWCKS